MLSRAIWIFLFSGLPILSIAQSESGIELSAQRGFLIPHRPVMKHLPLQNVTALEIGWCQQTNGRGLFGKTEKPWHALYHFPIWGISGLYTQTGNSTLLGTGYGLYGFLEPALHSGSLLDVKLRLGCGLGYLTKKFDPLENHKNIAIGSSFNMLVNARLMASLRLNRGEVWSALTFTHFSNGSLAAPNLGINLPGLQIGYRHRIGMDTTRHRVPEETVSNRHDILFTMGVKETHPEDRKKFPAFSVQFVGEFSLGPRSCLLYGADLMYNTSHLHILSKKGEAPDSDLSVLNPGINIGYGQRFNKLTLGIQMGYYVYRYYNFNGPVYHRLSGRYAFSEHLIGLFGIKAHYVKADYFEAGIGYRL